MFPFHELSEQYAVNKSKRNNPALSITISLPKQEYSSVFFMFYGLVHYKKFYDYVSKISVLMTWFRIGVGVKNVLKTAILNIWQAIFWFCIYCWIFRVVGVLDQEPSDREIIGVLSFSTAIVSV